jgi:NO-binding membrane sensor protein with MHYT domain/GGDEF domain-containing protein
MQGTYDPILVVLSVLIAALAGYVAIEFAGRLFSRRDQWVKWLAGGSLAMGSGIWAMHFVGMSALMMPIAITYDLGITVFSWIAAVLVSALALFIVSRGELTRFNLALGSLAMGAGVCVMHYSGMAAMKMDPGLGYDPFWFTVSVLIAVVASGAALVMVSALRTIRSWADVVRRMGAALAMGVAVAGMHYAGMAAVTFEAGAFCAPGNLLNGNLLTLPTVLVSLLGLGLAIYFAVNDARAAITAEREAKAAAERLELLAFVDRETGLPNRPRLSQLISEALASAKPYFGVVSVRVQDDNGGDGRALLPAVAKALSVEAQDGVVIARTSPDQLLVMLDSFQLRRAGQSLLPALKSLAESFGARGTQLAFGLAVAPEDGDTSQMIMLRAAARGGSLVELSQSLAAHGGPSLGTLMGYRADDAPPRRSSAA